MKTKNIKTGDRVLHRCHCGWAGTQRELAVWVQKNKIVARICPACGTQSQQLPEPALALTGPFSPTLH